ncbi:sugar transferase [Legionella brunensis]|uniref:Putative sugar transferase EpsL n=1 Tax=Legionella brunensis TaxID=29422 RepID=A0A0W0SDH9_9GAMM|nr:sugar transferase [Legionella brunensis]KTC81426.1 putative sugar transferase EpsL [Legionella brunensis]
MVKRIFDLFTASLLLILMAPILCCLALLIRWHMGSPILFRQQRPGLHGKPFYMVKFRTMLDSKDSNGIWLADDKRLTTLGKFLRASSLDEIPELWNVLKGEMSIVGPRPLLMEYLPLYNAKQRRRHEMKPGITGLAQVNGRNALAWEDKFKLDVWYIDNQSLWLDIKIMFLTIKKVLIRDGITSEGSVTAEKFKGSQQ